MTTINPQDVAALVEAIRKTWPEIEAGQETTRQRRLASKACDTLEALMRECERLRSAPARMQIVEAKRQAEAERGALAAKVEEWQQKLCRALEAAHMNGPPIQLSECLTVDDVVQSIKDASDGFQFVCAKLQKMEAVVEAARKYVKAEGFCAPQDAEDELTDALSTLDGDK